MGLKSLLAKPLASYFRNKILKESSNALALQELWLKQILQSAKDTQFGKDHGFSSIGSAKEFAAKVPVKDYEGLRSYIDQVVDGKPDVLWPGKPLYFAKTSGTTSGVKYIPISKESIPYHINSARNALFCYIAETGKADFLDGKLIFLSGSPVLTQKSGINTGRLSGIVNHHVPGYLRTNQMPSYATNCIEDWEQKVSAITQETLSENMTLISGIPPWVQMYFDKIYEQTGKKAGEQFPNFSLFVYGGVNFEPYRAKLEASIGRKVDTIETYPASEGFFAYQHSQLAEGLLLLVNNGIFYEFIKTDEFYTENPRRYTLAEVELHVNYALIITTNAGLYAYNIGDTVKFVSKDPYLIKVTGRIKHFISAFGEHVIGEEVEFALLTAAKEMGVSIVEFTVAPQVNPPEGGLPYHEWFIAFEEMPEDLTALASRTDELLQQKNIYYKDLLAGSILQTLKIRPLQKDAFIKYMKSQGKLGGQNKVPRLSNTREIAEALIEIS
jgi:hypothetical protein